MTKITDVVMRMQNELRNKEGITGIDAMHHINMVLLSKSFNNEMCEILGIPEELSFDNMSYLNQKDLMKKYYKRKPITDTLLYHIRVNQRFGYDKDIAFQIKNESTLKYLYTQVVEIPTEELFETVDIIGEIYEHFINREGKTMKDLGQYFTDRTLIKYLVNLVNPKLNKNGLCESIWDPSAGTGGFLIEYISYLNKNNENIDWSRNKNQIYGNDINKNTSALLKQNLYYSFREDCGPVDMKDSLLTDSDIKYDNILANPPFGIKGLKYKEMNRDIKALDIHGTKGEILFLQLCMTRLNENGKCAIVVPEGVLFNSTKMYKDTRKHLLENFNLKKVIKVGEGEFFKNTGVKTSVLFFEKTGQTENVEFIQVNKVNDQIVEVPLMIVEMDKIIENDYSLNMNLYKEIILDVNDDFEVVELGDLFTLEKGKIQSSKSIPGNYKLMSQSNKRTHNEYKYDGENLFISCVNPIGTIYYYNGRCNCSTLLYTLIPKTNTNVKYLYYYLKRNENMFKCCETGSANKSLSIDIFNKIKIPVPPQEVQNRIVEQLDNIYETEIEFSKKIVDSLKMSIETIMKNTMYRDDLQEYKIKDMYSIKYGNKHTTHEDPNNVYPCISGGSKVNKYTNKWNLPENTITIARSGSCGHVSMLPVKVLMGSYRFSLDVINLNGNNNAYIYNILKAFQTDIEGLALGSTVKNINRDILGGYKIRIPPIEIQQQILKKVEPKERLIQDLEKNIEMAQKEADDIMSVLFN